MFEEQKSTTSGFDMSLLEYRNPVWANAQHTSITLEVRWAAGDPWTEYATASFDPEPAGAAFFARVVSETGAENIGPYVAPPPQPYQLIMTDFWMRIADDDEYDAVLAAINSGSPRANRQAFNVAQTMMSDSVLFNWAKGLLTTALGAARTDELMAA